MPWRIFLVAPLTWQLPWQNFWKMNWLNNCPEENIWSHNWLDNCLDNFFGKIIDLTIALTWKISPTPMPRNNYHFRVITNFKFKNKTCIPFLSNSFCLADSKKMYCYFLHLTIYTVHCTVYSVHYTVYSVHYTLCTVHCTLYSKYSDPSSGWLQPAPPLPSPLPPRCFTGPSPYRYPAPISPIYSLLHLHLLPSPPPPPTFSKIKWR